MKATTKIERLFSGRKRAIIFLFLIFIISIVLYLDSINYNFLKDDFRLIVENQRIKTFKSYIESIDSKFFSFPDFPYLHYWRPFTMFTFFIDYQMWGLNPTGYHLTNILINAFNGVLVFLIFYLISKKDFYSLFITLLFTVHPSHVEAVSWISGRTDLLASFFIFMSILLLILFLKRGTIFLYIISTLSFVFALLSKENSALFPLVALLLILIFKPHDYDQKGNYKFIKKCWLYIRFTIPLFIIDIIYIILHNKFTGAQKVIENFSFNDMLVIFKTIGVYTKIVFFPFFPSPYFSMSDFMEHTYQHLVFFVFSVLILSLLVIKRDKYRTTLFSLLFVIFLLPVIDPEIIPSYPKIVLRFGYIAVVFSAAFFLDSIKLFTNKKMKVIYISLLIVIGFIWIIETLSFQDYFRDRVHYYSRLFKDYPDDGTIALPLALIKAENKEYNEALRLTNHALEVNNKDRWIDISEMAGLFKANLLILQGAEEQGKTIAENILNKTQREEMKYYSFLVLSKYYEVRGSFTESLKTLKRAEDVGVTTELLVRIVLIYTKMKNFDQALLYLNRIKELNPEMPRYYELKNHVLNEQKVSINGD